MGGPTVHSIRNRIRTHNPEVSTEHLFYNALAIMHSPAYRDENSGALRQDWPRGPLPKDTDRLLTSAALGRAIAVLRHIEGHDKSLGPAAGGGVGVHAARLHGAEKVAVL